MLLRLVILILSTLLIHTPTSFGEESVPIPAGGNPSPANNEPVSEEFKSALDSSSELKNIFEALQKSNSSAYAQIGNNGSVLTITKTESGSITYSVNGQTVWNGCAYSSCVTGNTLPVTPENNSQPGLIEQPIKSSDNTIELLQLELQKLDLQLIESKDSTSYTEILKSIVLAKAAINKQLIALQKNSNQLLNSDESYDSEKESSEYKPVNLSLILTELAAVDLSLNDESLTTDSDTLSSLMTSKALLLKQLNQIEKAYKTSSATSQPEPENFISVVDATQQVLLLREEVDILNLKLQTFSDYPPGHEVLKSIVSIQASVNKQIASLEKIVLQNIRESKITQSQISQESGFIVQIPFPFANQKIGITAQRGRKINKIVESTGQDGMLKIVSNKSLNGYRLTFRIPGVLKIANANRVSSN